MRISDWSSDVCSSDLRLAASVERVSEHQLALAIVEAAKARGLSTSDVGDFDSPTGSGELGTVDSRLIVLGNAGCLGDEGIATDYPDAQAATHQRHGAPALFIYCNSALAGKRLSDH